MKKWSPKYPITKPRDEREVLGVDPAKVTLVSISEWLYTYADLHVRLVWTGHDAASWRHFRGVGHRPASRQAYFSVNATLAIARDDLGEHIQVDGGQSSRKSAYTGSRSRAQPAPAPADASSASSTPTIHLSFSPCDIQLVSLRVLCPTTGDYTRQCSPKCSLAYAPGNWPPSQIYRSTSLNSPETPRDQHNLI